MIRVPVASTQVLKFSRDMILVDFKQPVIPTNVAFFTAFNLTQGTFLPRASYQRLLYLNRVILLSLDLSSKTCLYTYCMQTTLWRNHSSLQVQFSKIHITYSSTNMYSIFSISKIVPITKHFLRVPKN